MQRYTWFYSLNEALTPDQQVGLEEQFAAFLGQWKTHGDPVRGRIGIKYGRFVIVQADPGDDRPSGCSIDSMKKAVEQILQGHGRTWADPAQVWYLDPEGKPQSLDFRQVKERLSEGSLHEETLIFDHTLDQSDDLSKWEKPLKDTWLKRYLPQRV